jgi:hypothetical protein
MRVRKSPLEPFRRATLGLALSVIPAACEPARVHDVTIVDGASTTRFATKSAFAEYVELPGVRNELRVTLANYPVSCEHWAVPKSGEVALTITIVTPSEARPVPASYAWTGLPSREEPLHAAYSLPKALLGERSRLFEPGGAVRLTAAALELHGSVTGALAFEYPGDGTRPATRIDGGFEAKICRSSVATR